MPRTPPPLLGFNNNVKHRGRIFHIQTEDSGVKRPHVITHLFADGGRIVRSKKTNYAEHVGQDDTVTIVRKVMKTQHKAMFIALRGGDFDDLIEDICGEHPLPPAPIPEKLLRAREAARAKLASVHDGQPAPAPDAPPAPAPAAPPAPAAESAAEPAPRSSKRLSNPNLQRVTAEMAKAALANGELDIDVEKHLGGREVSRPEGATPVHGTPAAASKIPPDPEHPGRYAASRPAAIFESRPDEGSIFGGGISEQSLDDVILSYIAEDLEEDAPSE